MQPRFLVLLVLVSAFCVGHVHGQSSGGEDGLWSSLKKMVKDFVDSMRKIWQDMRSEIRARTGDMSSWTREMFDAFKVKMKEWVDQVNGAPDSEKEDMRNYIERLELPRDQ